MISVCLSHCRRSTWGFILLFANKLCLNIAIDRPGCRLSQFATDESEIIAWRPSSVERKLPSLSSRLIIVQANVVHCPSLALFRLPRPLPLLLVAVCFYEAIILLVVCCGLCFYVVVSFFRFCCESCLCILMASIRAGAMWLWILHVMAVVTVFNVSSS